MSTTTALPARKCHDCKRPTRSPDGYCHLHTGGRRIAAASPATAPAPAAPAAHDAREVQLLDSSSAPAVAAALNESEVVVAAVIAAATNHLAAGTRPNPESNLSSRLRALTSDPAVLGALATSTGSSRKKVDEQMSAVAAALVPPKPVSRREAAELALEFERISAELERHAAPRLERLEQIKGRLRASVGMGGVEEGHNDYEDGLRLEMFTTKNFDPALAKEALTKAEIKAISVSKMDPGMAKRLLDKDAYERCRKAGTTRVEVKRVVPKD